MHSSSSSQTYCFRTFFELCFTLLRPYGDSHIIEDDDETGEIKVRPSHRADARDYLEITLTPLDMKPHADIADYEDSTAEPDRKVTLEMSAVSYL